MDEASQQILQHPVVGLVASPPLRMDSLGQLRMDSLDTPGSGKMVSLADLHVNSGGPVVTPGTVDSQGVDPLDPLLQLLVQDRLFIAAVQTSQLHAAAATAVKLLRSQFTGPHDFKRPADRRRHAAADGYELDPRGPGAARLHGRHLALGPGLRAVKQDVLQVEDTIPWTSVRRTWRNRRTSWRRQVKATELVTELAARLKELRLHLLADDASFIGCGQAWRAQLEACSQGRGSAAVLASVWDEMKNTVRSWLGTSGAGGGGGGGEGAAGSGAVQAGPSRAVQALQAAVRHGGMDALLQAPLEAIVGGDSCGLHAVRQAIELERRIVAARLAALQPGAVPPAEPLVSYFTSISAAWEDSDFDSGAESEADEEGSEATQLDSDFDA